MVTPGLSCKGGTERQKQQTEPAGFSCIQEIQGLLGISWVLLETLVLSWQPGGGYEQCT